MTKMASIDPNLDQNLAWLKEKFDGSADFFTKKMQLCGVECAVMLCDDLAGVDLAWELLLRPLQYEPRRFSDGAELAKYLAVHSGVPFFRSTDRNQRGPVLQSLCWQRGVLGRRRLQGLLLCCAEFCPAVSR